MRIKVTIHQGTISTLQIGPFNLWSFFIFLDTYSSSWNITIGGAKAWHYQTRYKVWDIATNHLDIVVNTSCYWDTGYRRIPVCTFLLGYNYLLAHSCRCRAPDTTCQPDTRHMTRDMWYHDTTRVHLPCTWWPRTPRCWYPPTSSGSSGPTSCWIWKVRYPCSWTVWLRQTTWPWHVSSPRLVDGESVCKYRCSAPRGSTCPLTDTRSNHGRTCTGLREPERSSPAPGPRPAASCWWHWSGLWPPPWPPCLGTCCGRQQSPPSWTGTRQRPRCLQCHRIVKLLQPLHNG